MTYNGSAMWTWRKKSMLRFIHKHLINYGYAPSVREIQAACGISSTSVVAYNLQALQDMGLIAVGDNKARSIVLLEKAADYVR